MLDSVVVVPVTLVVVDDTVVVLLVRLDVVDVAVIVVLVPLAVVLDIVVVVVVLVDCTITFSAATLNLYSSYPAAQVSIVSMYVLPIGTGSANCSVIM